MAFVYEKLTERDEEFFESFDFKHPAFTDRTAETPQDWVIDRSRKIWLMSLGMLSAAIVRAENWKTIYYYALVMGSHVVRIDITSSGKGNNSIGVKKEIEVKKIKTTQKCKEKFGETIIIETLRQAFDTEVRRNDVNIISLDFTGMVTIDIVEEGELNV